MWRDERTRNDLPPFFILRRISQLSSTSLRNKRKTCLTWVVLCLKEITLTSCCDLRAKYNLLMFYWLLYHCFCPCSNKQNPEFMEVPHRLKITFGYSCIHLSSHILTHPCTTLALTTVDKQMWYKRTYICKRSLNWLLWKGKLALLTHYTQAKRRRKKQHANTTNNTLCCSLISQHLPQLMCCVSGKHGRHFQSEKNHMTNHTNPCLSFMLLLTEGVVDDFKQSKVAGCYAVHP